MHFDNHKLVSYIALVFRLNKCKSVQRKKLSFGKFVSIIDIWCVCVKDNVRFKPDHMYNTSYRLPYLVYKNKWGYPDEYA